MRVLGMFLSSMVGMAINQDDEYDEELFETTEVVVPPGEISILFLSLLFLSRLWSEV